MPWNQLHPKIRTAAIAALVVAVVNIANAIIDVYPNEAWTQLLSAVIPVIAGYLQSAEPKA